MELDVLKQAWQQQTTVDMPQVKINRQAAAARLRRQAGPLERMTSSRQALGSLLTSLMFGLLYPLAMYVGGQGGWNVAVFVAIASLAAIKHGRDYLRLRRLERVQAEQTVSYLQSTLQRIDLYRQQVRWIRWAPSLIILVGAVAVLTPGETELGLKGWIGIGAFTAFAFAISSVLVRHFYLAELKRYETLGEEIQALLHEWQQER